MCCTNWIPREFLVEEVEVVVEVVPRYLKFGLMYVKEWIHRDLCILLED